MFSLFKEKNSNAFPITNTAVLSNRYKSLRIDFFEAKPKKKNGYPSCARANELLKTVFFILNILGFLLQ